MAVRPRRPSLFSSRLTVILVDTSAWVEFLRNSGSPVHRHLRRLIERDAKLATSEVVVMEVLAGARDDDHSQRLRRMLFGCELLPLQRLTDYEAAAGLYRQCRRQGETVRRPTDCLIAVVALRARASILHADTDFDILAQHTGLKIERADRI